MTDQPQNQPPHDVELTYPSYQPSKAEKEAPIEFPEGTHVAGGAPPITAPSCAGAPVKRESARHSAVRVAGRSFGWRDRVPGGGWAQAATGVDSSQRPKRVYAIISAVSGSWLRT